MEVAPREVGLGLFEEAVRIGAMPRDATELAQVEHRVVARIAEHLVFAEEFRVLAEPLAQVTESGGRLKGDLTRAERRRHLEQRLQLLANAEPVSRRSDRHAAGSGDPGSGRDVAAGQVRTTLFRLARFRSKVAVEGINDPSIDLEIYAATLLTSKEFASGGLELREGCAPFPQHKQKSTKRMFACQCLIYTTPARPTCMKPPKPHPNTLFTALTDAPRPTYVPENHHPRPTTSE